MPEKPPFLAPREIAALLLTALFVVTSLLVYAHTSPTASTEPTIIKTQRDPSEEARVEEPEVDAPGMLPGEVLDLNTATPGDLTRLPGIGEARAEAIVTWREENGGFQTIEQIQEVYGIGPATLERITPYITVTPTQQASD